ncbi:MAG: citramalate synthase [Proteobacteria bacterium]|nr:citramalate synthase [Pseudomonadota bacterium]NCA27747.1 citramalate synthase [Pseudomonadota bacterium]
MTKKPRVYLYDSTLRDGAQTSTVNFSVQNKIQISKMLDNIGIDFIEGGWPGANPIDDEFFNNLPALQKSSFVAFGMTRRSNASAGNDGSLNSLINSPVQSICIVGKSWDFHLTHALHISERENLAMIEESIKQIIKKKKIAMFDAEHFFDGFKANSDFALKVVKTAFNAGAKWIILCDTNGGTIPSEIKSIISEVIKYIPGENLGIHCHNDTENAVANSISAVEAGVRQVQGTINGLGERCGNANLVSIIPTLALKMGYDVGINDFQLANLTKLSHFLDDILNKESNKFAPYVGKYAFAHKGGLHVSAVAKNSQSYEHIEPEKVGNKRMIMVSNQAGKSNIINRLKEINLVSNEEIYGDKISELVNLVKDQEAKGYAYDSADASFEILAKKTLSIVPNFFELVSFSVLDNRSYDKKGSVITFAKASIEIKVNNKILKAEAKGNGPVNALDIALRKALSRKYPILKNIKLCDYKVRILTPSDGTQAITRVQIESANDKNERWTTIGVSQNIVDASFRALHDSMTYCLMHQ